MKNIFLALILGIALAGCNKNNDSHPCFDNSLVHDNFCTDDCSGFAGCDGNHYCNECEAARVGIGPE